MDAQSLPGWYPDPVDRHTHRWWSGADWTDHVSDGDGNVAVDPMTTPPGATTTMPQGRPADDTAGAEPVDAAPVAAPSASPRRAFPTLPVVGGVAIVAVAAAAIFFITRDSGEDAPPDAAPTAETAGGQTTVIHSAEGGSFTSVDGVGVQVPSGAVPLSVDGEPGTIAFSVDVVDDPAAFEGATLPDGVTIDDTVYEFGPTGQSFDAPVTIDLPLEPGVDPVDVGGIAYFDHGAGAWNRVASTVDPDGAVVSAEVMHFSPYSIWFRSRNDGRDDWERTNGGWISVTNEAVGSYGFGGFPVTLFGPDAPRYQQTSTSYGVCIIGYDLVDDSLASYAGFYADSAQPLTVYATIDRPGFSAQGGTRDFWLPAGTYELVEVWYPSEINWGADPLYVPRRGSAYRPYGPVVLAAGDRLELVEEERIAPNPGTDDGWVAQRHPCIGEPMPSLGSGTVQVSLNWPESGVDLDLYVTDPAGETISYGAPTSSSGGQLDNDNREGAGTPENIFWGGTAPSGTYQVRVNYFGGSQPATWTVSVLVDGQRETFSGRLDSGSVDVTTFGVD